MAEPEGQLGTSPNRDHELWEAAMGHSAQQLLQEQQQGGQPRLQRPSPGLQTMGQQPSAAAPQSIGALPSNTMQPPSRRQSQQQSIPHQSIPHQPYQQNLGYQSMMMGNYGIPTSHGPNEPEMLRPNHPTYSLPPPNSSRPMDQFAGWPEAPAAMGSTPQMGRPIGSIGQVGGPSIGKVGSSASIGQVGSSTPSIGRVSVGQKGPLNPRGIGQVSGASIGQVGSSIGQGNMMGMQGVGTANRPGNSNAPSQYGDSNGPPSLPNHVSIHSVPDSVGGASEPGLDKLTSAASLASNIRGPKIKIICSSGGHFQKITGGGMEYVGGETRLISVASTCNFTELSGALDRVTGSLTIHSGQSIASGSDSAPSLRYQLPSDPNVYVDLVDTEDVKMMFDEWQEWLAEEKRPSSSKLHIYIQNVGTKVPSDAPATPNASQPPPAFSKATSGKGSDTVAPNRTSANSSAGEAVAGQSAGAPSLASNDSWKKRGLEDIAERMEVISPEDVSLVKFIGSGGYGEVYLGKWHSSEAAIKCLNTSLFTSTSDSGARVSHAAINELIREAELLGSLRHPNVVWVYGIVLPPVEEPQDSEDLDALIDSAEPIEIASAMSHQGPPGGGGGGGGRGGPGQLRPPAIITEFMSQGSLKGALSRRLEVLQPPLMRLMVALDAAKGMEYLHAKRIVHFDLKSANLLLGHRDKRLICKVADFGLSKQKRDTYVTGVTSQRGTLPWIAPEIIKSPHAVNEKVDVFSFGVVLWEIWTGKEPYEGLNYHALLHQLTSVSGLRPPLPGSPDAKPSSRAHGYACELEDGANQAG
ncbi:hypothetical protein WJX84_004717 [Apatococcus fuscideae]|uniref:Protein kinase domain-containing protein n=1 Tax=Apatococcus fuscideae TaxID=2026836 RepID=A0AAW1SVR5_9CHLO